MAWHIVKQPNGRLARFFDIAGDFTSMNMTEDEALGLCRTCLGIDEARRKVQAGVEDWKPWTNGIKGSGTERWEHCLSAIEAVHGKEAARWRCSMGIAAPEPVADGAETKEN